jgi:hypothetical protein
MSLDKKRKLDILHRDRVNKKCKIIIDINILPVELHTYILSFFPDIVDGLNFRLVCKLWKNITRSTVSFAILYPTRKINMPCVHDSQNPFRIRCWKSLHFGKIFGLFPNIKTLDIRRELSKAEIYIFYPPKIFYSNGYDESIQSKIIPSIEHFYFRNVKIKSTKLVSFFTSSIKSFFWESEYDDSEYCLHSILMSLAKGPKFTSLTILDKKDYCNECARAYGSMKTLESLTMLGCIGFDRSFFTHISELPKLKEMTIIDTFYRWDKIKKKSQCQLFPSLKKLIIDTQYDGPDDDRKRVIDNILYSVLTQRTKYLEIRLLNKVDKCSYVSNIADPDKLIIQK